MTEFSTYRVLAADVGGSFIKMAAVGPSSEMRILRCATPAEDIEAFLASVEEMVRRLADEVSPAAPLALATAGLVDPDTGTISAANIPCLNGKPLRNLLSPRLGRPVVVLNDADAFALAEASLGAGRGHSVVFGAIIGTGIGGGLVVEGRTVRGPGGIAGEWGHGPIALSHSKRLGRDIPRMRCGCGREGCADTFGGARGMERLHRLLGRAGADSRTIIAGWRSGDPACRETVDLWAEMLAEPLALTINVTGTSIVPVGGGLASVPPLIALLDSEVRSRILLDTDSPIVVPSRLGEEAGLLGASIHGRQVVGQPI